MCHSDSKQGHTGPHRRQAARSRVATGDIRAACLRGPGPRCRSGVGTARRSSRGPCRAGRWPTGRKDSSGRRRATDRGATRLPGSRGDVELGRREPDRAHLRAFDRDVLEGIASRTGHAPGSTRSGPGSPRRPRRPRLGGEVAHLRRRPAEALVERGVHGPRESGTGWAGACGTDHAKSALGSHRPSDLSSDMVPYRLGELLLCARRSAPSRDVAAR
jgi:hypothetical protein